MWSDYRVEHSACSDLVKFDLQIYFDKNEKKFSLEHVHTNRYTRALAGTPHHTHMYIQEKGNPDTTYEKRNLFVILQLLIYTKLSVAQGQIERNECRGIVFIKAFLP